MRSLGFAFWCSKMHFVCTIHAMFPFYFEDTFSEAVHKMSEKLKQEEMRNDRKQD